MHNMTMNRPSWIKIYGEEFHRSDFVHIGWQADDLPEFAKINDILAVGGFPLIAVEKYKSEGICNHLFAYLIHRAHSKTVIYLPNLLNKQIYSAHAFLGDGGLYVVMRSHVENTQ